MVVSTGILIWGNASGGPKDDFTTGFVWATSILLGIVAMAGATIQGFAQSPAPAPLEEAASHLRILLLYTGLAWGAGAFLILPSLSAFIFAAGPAWLAP
ncbi:MAG TPA: hypothetical protein VEM35_04100 [Rhizomicrobium sp.]|nr:hypothetical protein [Rhizomicrobium sp.]